MSDFCTSPMISWIIQPIFKNQTVFDILSLLLAVGGGSFRSPLRYFSDVPFPNGWRKGAETLWLLRDIHCGHSVKVLDQGQVRSPGQVRWPPSKISRPRHGYRSRRISMKLTGLLEVINAYLMCVSEFLSWWPKVRSISWPPHHKYTGKYGNTSRFA